MIRLLTVAVAACRALATRRAGRLSTRPTLTGAPEVGPAVQPPPPGDGQVAATVAALRAGAVARSAWACWGCLPTLDVTVDRDAAITVTTVHSAACIAAAEWLFSTRPEPPPGAMPCLHHPTRKEPG